MKNITTLYSIRRFTDQCFDRDNEKAAGMIKGILDAIHQEYLIYQTKWMVIPLWYLFPQHLPGWLSKWHFSTTGCRIVWTRFS